MTGRASTLEIRTAPHVLSGYGVDAIMFNVVVALLPTTAFGIYVFGLPAALTIGVALAACLLTEHAVCRVAGRPSTLGDWSAAITGLLYGLTLPPGLPLWMTALGGVVCIGLGKALFGGLGRNPFNPALVGRAVLQAAFPVAMTSWLPALAPDRFAALPPSTLTLPFTTPLYDVVTGATPLAQWKFGQVLTDSGALAMGMVSGSSGETSAVLILAGGAWLVARNMMSWRIPLAVLGSVALGAALLHQLDPAHYAPASFHLFSGGLMLGAVFMATDMVASPMTALGAWLYGALIGVLTLVIRTWGGMPEGVMYAILLANAVSPLIDRVIRPRRYGSRGAPA